MIGKRIKLMTFILCCLALATSCNDSPEHPALDTAKVVIAISNLPESQTRTITPEIYERPDYLEISLSKVDYKESGQQASTTEKDKYIKEFDATADSFTFEKVEIGYYSVSVSGYDKSEDGSRIVMMAASTDDGEFLSVEPGKTNSIEIRLETLAEGEQYGAIRLAFDWTEALSTSSRLEEATAGGIDLVLMMNLPGTDTYANVAEVNTEPGATSAVIETDGIPAGRAIPTIVRMYDKNCFFVSQPLSTTTNIFSNQTSTFDSHEPNVVDGVLFLTPDMIPTPENVGNVSWKYGESPAEQITVTWTNGSEIEKVLLSWGKVMDMVETGTAEIDLSEGNVESYTISGLEPGERMFVSFQAVLKDGAKTEKAVYMFDDNPMMAKTLVEGIAIAEENIPSAPLSYGDTFELEAKVTPDDATFPGYSWSLSTPGVLLVSGNTFTANIPGRTYITAVSDDDPDMTDTTTKEIVVHLATPQSISAAETENGIYVSWNSVPYAEEYVVMRKEGSSGAEEIATVSDTFYKDSDIVTGTAYTYTVKATAPGFDEEGFSASSELSDASSPISIDIPSFEIVWPEIPQLGNVSINKSASALLPTMDKITISVETEDKSEIVEYTWMLNGNLASITTTSANYLDITKNTVGLKKGYQDYSNTLSVTMKDKNGNTFSTSIGFTAVDVLDSGVALSTPYGKIGRISANLESGEARRLQMKASVMPADATIKTVTYESSNPQIASVDQYTGLVTFNPDSTGEVTITARTYSGKEDSITLTSYRNTITDAQSLLNSVNAILREYIIAADAAIGDWYSSVTKDYTAENGSVYIRNKSDLPSASASMTLKNLSRTIGDESYVMNGAIGIGYVDKGTWGVGGTDEIGTFGSDNATLTIELPYDQGNAYIQYMSVNLNGSTRSGSYKVSFEESLGFDPENPVQAISYTIGDSENTTRLI